MASLTGLLLCAALSFGQEGGAGRATLAAVGDIRLDGPVGELIRRFGPRHPTSKLGAALRADVVLGNLECSVTRRGKKLEKTWNFRSPPEHLAALAQGGFNLVTVANNHSFDYGREGFLDTLAHLRKAGLAFIGGGRDRAEAESLRVIEKNGLRIGFLGFTSTHPEQAWARADKPGVAYSDFGRLPSIVASARPRVDVLVVVFHGGTELAKEPNSIQKAFARAAVEAGADLVIGHHPHVLQPVEVYRGKPILYSIGNFLFVSPSPATRDTVVAQAVLSKQGVERISFIPFDTNWGSPKPADAPGIRAITAALDGGGALAAHPERFQVTPLPQIR